MPAISGRQYRYMAALAHGAKPRGGKGPSPAVAEEFVQATPPEDRSKWAKKPKRRARRVIG